MTSFTVKVKRVTPSATTIGCSGELDVASCGRLIDAIESAYVPGLAVLKVDLFEVTFIDSTGMGCLIHGALQSTKRGVRFEIVPGQATLDLMRTTGLGSHLRVVPPSPA
jgi:anti-anti-sigma factor